ncbi:MAG: hypothetical protein V4535_09445 [Bacteroidota bacterium]
MATFSLKFDSDHGDVDFSNAISIDDLGELLKSLYLAIDASKSDKIILTTVVDNCYELGISTINPVIEPKVEKLTKSIFEKSDLELNQKESRFKSSVVKALKPGWFLDILNADGVKVITLPYGFNEKTIETYNSIKNIEGFITEIGNKELDAKSLHIYLSENADFKIFVNIEQHDELMKFYRKAKIRAKVNLKKSLSTDKILSANLIGFKHKNEFNFPYNLNDIDFSDINFVHGY